MSEDLVTMSPRKLLELNLWNDFCKKYNKNYDYDFLLKNQLLNLDSILILSLKDYETLLENKKEKEKK